MSPKSEELLRPRDAAVVLGISYASLKQWIYKGKLRTVKTAGGHHRIPQSEIDRFPLQVAGQAAGGEPRELPQHQRAQSAGGTDRGSAYRRA